MSLISIASFNGHRWFRIFCLTLEGNNISWIWFHYLLFFSAWLFLICMVNRTESLTLHIHAELSVMNYLNWRWNDNMMLTSDSIIMCLFLWSMSMFSFKLTGHNVNTAILMFIVIYYYTFTIIPVIPLTIYVIITHWL